MMKWKARTETMDIGVLSLGSLTFNEDYREVSIDICDMSDSLKAEVEKAVELRKAESVKEWAEICRVHPELTKHDRTWSSKPAVIDYTYLRIILEGGKAITYSIEAGFHDADNDHLEECAGMKADLSEHTKIEKGSDQRMVQRNEITFDNAVQRGYVWDNKKKSLLIHSMLSGYPIPPFYAVKNDDKYDMLDGKQRINAIADFIAGKFELEGIPEVESPNDDGTSDMVDINTLHFNELEESLRDELQDYSLTAYYFDAVTDEEISEMFFRLNNGKPLSAVELTRVRAKSMNTIISLFSGNIYK